MKKLIPVYALSLGLLLTGCKTEKKEAEINWNKSAMLLERCVCAFNPWPVAYTLLNGQTLRVWRAHALDGEQEHDAPAEAEPGSDSNPYGGDPYAMGLGVSGSGRVKKKEIIEVKAAPAPPPPSRAKSGPRRVTAEMTPPKALGANPTPMYPEAARSAGITGTVIVRYVISEAGKVISAQAVRGPAELKDACVAAVRNWTFSPALDESGQPVSVVKIARFPFNLT